MLTAHLQPTLQGAAGRSEREPGVPCQDLETQVNMVLEQTQIEMWSKVLGLFGVGVRVSFFGLDPSDFFPPQEAPPKSHCTLLYPPLDTCDTPIAPLEAPLQGGGLGCSRPGCSTGIAGRAGDRLGGPGALSPLFRGALPTLIALPAMPHMPLRLGLGLLFMELRSVGSGG